jgi:3-methyladenine DNA glycosylase AlkD
VPTKKKTPGARPNSKKAGAKRAAPAGDHDVDAVVASLERLGSSRVREDMSERYGILLPDPSRAFGVPVGKIQQVAKSLGTSHELAAALWQSGWYEARLLASFVDDPERVTGAQMDRWARDFDNWGVCDTVCFHLFDRVETELAFRKVDQWGAKKQEFVKRASFALLASLALHAKDAPDNLFLARLPLIERGASDDRNFVKKGVSWALRSIGRRTPALRTACLELSEQLAASASAPARWIGRDAIRDLSRAAKPARERP